jgi:DMSO/TMAO reductase YedYZ molybdopterin-dependent catalytic subunit
VTRRQYLLFSGAAAATRRLFGAEQEQQRNLSYPLREIQGSVTPRELFFVRDHFTEPDVSLESWKLRVEGDVAHPYDLTFSDLLELPAKKMEAVLECAGNAPHGSAVSNGVWEGTSLGALLKQAAAPATAKLVVLIGADAGRLFDDRSRAPYAQLVPMSKCLDPSSLVAYKLNGLFLPPQNGFPARAFFPGWYAMDSVKWLQRVVVIDADVKAAEFHDVGLDRLYNRVLNVGGQEKTTRLSGLQVKSVLAWPTDSLKLPAATHEVRGFAWTGAGSIRAVRVSVDGGKTWAPAQLESRAEQYKWVKWTFSWRAAPGDYLLMSRAVDTFGNEQPLTRDRARKDGYEANWCMPVRCSVG